MDYYDECAGILSQKCPLYVSDVKEKTVSVLVNLLIRAYIVIDRRVCLQNLSF